jgi:hypothetical protein
MAESFYKLKFGGLLPWATVVVVNDVRWCCKSARQVLPWVKGDSTMGRVGYILLHTFIFFAILMSPSCYNCIAILHHTRFCEFASYEEIRYNPFAYLLQQNKKIM